MREILINALRAGGKVQLGYFERQFEIIQKESQSSVVTVADIESERVIIDIIRAAFPEHNIVSEECGLVNNGSEFTWVVDPLNGPVTIDGRVDEPAWTEITPLPMVTHIPVYGTYL